ncbi:hypothetical protein [Engelhardtia mirabilis]|uniref:Uncharacterized protein n=1 Tax=Engelhardtia mirabilis TaxID=2528011 RepID=A0A518BMI4_9BACT|nr:hypothetical protein Pla133_32860 [Planctomycetes bacterium Pla133]QDV02518.1 hypothetical protein Pla86_32850 [Planctomycetes bacterium Pla86]
MTAISLAGALEALEAEDLRELLREALPDLDERARGMMVDRLVACAARKGSGWEPEGPDDDAVAEVLSFAKTAERSHYADPRAVDRFLRRGTGAFLRKDYEGARRIFHALLPPIAVADIDLGQDEMADEVLTVDIGQCAARYLVATYMTVDPGERAEAVHAALRAAGNLGLFWEPLSEMESVAVEPLPDLGGFLARWRALIEKEAAGGASRGGWDSDEDRWMREVVQRLEGVDGLAAHARATRRGQDLRVWCRALVEVTDWKAALAAFEEAAETVRDDSHRRGEFLDGAALAAQELGRRDLPARLEQVWREAPSLVRLRRWLGAARTAARIRSSTVEALEACPKRDERQRAVLHMVVGDLESAAKRLSAAPGLGWSSPEHPGHLVFPLFAELLGDGDSGAGSGRRPSPVRCMDLDELGPMNADPDEPRLRAPDVAAILEAAGVRRPICAEARSAMLAAMRKAAEKRVEGVTKEQRRRHYGHAAQLVAACANLDATPEGGRWIARLRSRYSRYPALQGELDEHLGTARHGRRG